MCRLLPLSGDAVWLFDSNQLIFSAVIPSDLLSVGQGWRILIQCEIDRHRFVLQWCRENWTSVLLLLLLHKLLLMLLDINLRLLFGSSSDSGVSRPAASNPIECAADSSQQLGPWWNQWLLYVRVDLSNHDPADLNCAWWHHRSRHSGCSVSTTVHHNA